jgi:hypothetical protein
MEECQEPVFDAVQDGCCGMGAIEAGQDLRHDTVFYWGGVIRVPRVRAIDHAFCATNKTHNDDNHHDGTSREWGTATT